MIAIVDIGVGNMGAVKNMLRKVKAEAVIVDNPGDLKAADKIILPGVGAFDAGMRRLAETGFKDALDERVLKDGVPVMGICLGAQLLGRGSEEGDLPGLGWLDMEAVRFPGDMGLRVPHMGWNQVSPAGGHPMFQGLDDDMRFYFAHSYYLRPAGDETVAGRAAYGIEFAAAVGRGKIWGAQFHPEKSHRFGAQVLQNFAAAA